MKQILTGNILTVNSRDLLFIAPLYGAIGITHALVRHRLSPASSGAARWWWDFFFYASFGLVVTSSVALAGVLLVFSFLIIPAAIGRLYAQSFARELVIGWIAGSVASLLGLSVSYAWDLPTGAAMVCVFGISLVLAGIIQPLRRRSRGTFAAAANGLRIAFALVFALSGLWLMIAPRADQPLVNGIESLLPGLRSVYMRASSSTLGATPTTTRNAMPARSMRSTSARRRAAGRQGAGRHRGAQNLVLSQSYGEMRKGETFVMHEVRSRARERARWSMGLSMILIGLAAVPWRKRLAGFRGAIK